MNEVTSLRFNPQSPSDVATLKREILRKLAYSLGKRPSAAAPHDWLTAAILALRDRIIDVWQETTAESYQTGRKRVYYLSLEFLIGRSFANALNNFGLTDTMRTALAELGVDFDAIEAIEPDAALGNGGLGRLAACYLESMATIGVPCLGYGIRYDHGLFRQHIVGGQQTEVPEDWLTFRNPWEFERRESAYQVGFGGSVSNSDHLGGAAWTPSETIFAVAYDTPIIGWRGADAVTLRLWRARSERPLQLKVFNEGDHLGAHAERNRAEAISNILYPNDSTLAGQELRLRQEYFFTAASLQDIVRRHLRQFGDLRSLPEKAAIQLNDTHPALAVAELMRILIDEHGVEWRDAWSIVNATVSYTNHTLLPEALETWPVSLMERVLPRHMQIIFVINAKFLEQARTDHPATDLSRLSLIDEHNGRRVRMAHLAFLGSHTVNGVSELHSSLMRTTVFQPLHDIFPQRIRNVTNGITPRRWLLAANPRLADLIARACGGEIFDDVSIVSRFAASANDSATQDEIAAIRKDNKQKLASYIRREIGLSINLDAMFDAQIKRVHEYKRQLLNILETVALYDAMRAEPYQEWRPRVKVFAGKAASNYVVAKLIINLINDVAAVVNNDALTRDKLQIVFLPNYNVSVAEIVIPATDLSEQISTAGMEASGTGNMKFALNGALTVGTLDGANIEIRERVGDENIFIFGMTAEEVEQARARHDIEAVIDRTPHLRDVLEAVSQGAFSPGEPERYTGLVSELRRNDWFMSVRDFESYRLAQRRVDSLWADQRAWRRMSILNTAGCGWFSSDRAVRQYASDIWRTPFRDAAK